MFTKSRADSRSLINPHKMNPLALSTGHFNVTLTTISFGLSSSLEHIFYSTHSVYNFTCVFTMKRAVLSCANLCCLLKSDPLCLRKMLLNTQYSQEVVSYEQTRIFESSFIPNFVLQVSILSFESRTQVAIFQAKSILSSTTPP